MITPCGGGARAEEALDWSFLGTGWAELLPHYQCNSDSDFEWNCGTVTTEEAKQKLSKSVNLEEGKNSNKNKNPKVHKSAVPAPQCAAHLAPGTDN